MAADSQDFFTLKWGFLYKRPIKLYIVTPPSYLNDSPFKGTFQQDFLPPIFSQMDSFQAPYSVFKDFLNLASNLRRYSRFFIHSPLLFILESPYSLYCYYGELQLSLSLYQESLFVRIICINSRLLFNTESLYSPYCLLQESLLSASFIVGSHCWQQRVIFKNSEGLYLPFKGQWIKNESYMSRTLLIKNILKG
jgi:hypothetical protein